MTLTKKILLALGVAAAAGAMHAQMTSTTTPVGVLGHSYTELSLGLQDIKNLSPHFYDASIGGNVPVTPNLDLAAGYSYGWIRGSAFGTSLRGHSNTVTTTATAYTLTGGVKPFVGVGLGYEWTHFAGFRDNHGLWGAAVGVEIPAGRVSITPRIVYADDFESSSSSSQQTTYEVEGNYWVSAKTGVFASLGKTDVHHDSGESWNYRLGVRMKY
jgi:hypothetical protein